MIIAKCSNCGKTYRIPKERLPTGKKVSFSCPNCKGRIVLDLRTSPVSDPFSPHRSQLQSEKPHRSQLQSEKKQRQGEKKQSHREPTPDEAHQLLDRIEDSIYASGIDKGPKSHGKS